MIDVELLKDNIDCYMVLNEIGATVTRSGQVYCPFCADAFSRKPGAGVYADGERYKCFVCGLSGDVITLAQEHTGGDFKEAVEWLQMTFGA